MTWWTAYQHFRERFREALDERLYPLAYLDRLIRSGQAKFIWADDAAIVFEIRVYPSGAKDLHGLVAAGNLETIIGELIPAAEAWAKAHGCLGAVIESRPAWAKVMKSSGYEPHQVAVRKEL